MSGTPPVIPHHPDADLYADPEYRPSRQDALACYRAVHAVLPRGEKFHCDIAPWWFEFVLDAVEMSHRIDVCALAADLPANHASQPMVSATLSEGLACEFAAAALGAIIPYGHPAVLYGECVITAPDGEDLRIGGVLTDEPQERLVFPVPWVVSTHMFVGTPQGESERFLMDLLSGTVIRVASGRPCPRALIHGVSGAGETRRYTPCPLLTALWARRVAMLLLMRPVIGTLARFLEARTPVYQEQIDALREVYEGRRHGGGQKEDQG